MKTILLKSIDEQKNEKKELVIFDEIIHGTFSCEKFVFAFTGSNNGLPVYPLSYIIENYKFPVKNDKSKDEIIQFIKFNYLEEYNKIQFYESDEIEITPISPRNIHGKKYKLPDQQKECYVCGEIIDLKKDCFITEKDDKYIQYFHEDCWTGYIEQFGKKVEQVKNQQEYYWIIVFVMDKDKHPKLAKEPDSYVEVDAFGGLITFPSESLAKKYIEDFKLKAICAKIPSLIRRISSI